MVLSPAAEYFFTGVSLILLMECVHSVGAILPVRKYFLLMTSHNNVTLSNMENGLHHFHTFKDVFLLGRASNTAKMKAIILRTKLMKK
jgi:hypothetical protein